MTDVPYSHGVRLGQCPTCLAFLVVRPDHYGTWMIPFHPPAPTESREGLRHCQGSGEPERFSSDGRYL